MDYMRPLLDKIGVSGDTRCIKDYDGRAWGRSGILSTLRDFAKVAELVGVRGKHGDEQRGVPSGRELDCLAIGEWIERDKLLIRVYITDVSFGSIFALISLKDNMAALQFKKCGEFILDDYGGTALGRRE